MTDCLYEINSASGFESDHNGQCPRGAGHLKVTHHVRVGGYCALVCDSCATELNKRKDAAIRELVVPVQLSVPAVPAVYARHVGGVI